ncbi:MAG: MarR family winged helix-turn-helix transcriptional regulator [Steroidobacteraceae bacterium]
MSRSTESADLRDNASPVAAALEFGPLNRLAGYQLRRAHSRFFSNFAESLAEYSVTPVQLGLLLMINHNPGVSQTALARAVGIERSTLGEFIDRFQDRKLVERRGSLVDRRSHALHLTIEGATFVKNVMPAVFAHEESVMSVLTPADQVTLVRLLAQIARD